MVKVSDAFRPSLIYFDIHPDIMSEIIPPKQYDEIQYLEPKPSPEYEEFGYFDPMYCCMRCGMKKTIVRIIRRGADQEIHEEWQMFDPEAFTRCIFYNFNRNYNIYSYCSRSCFNNAYESEEGDIAVTDSTDAYPMKVSRILVVRRALSLCYRNEE